MSDPTLGEVIESALQEWHVRAAVGGLPDPRPSRAEFLLTRLAEAGFVVQARPRPVPDVGKPCVYGHDLG